MRPRPLCVLAAGCFALLMAQESSAQPTLAPPTTTQPAAAPTSVTSCSGATSRLRFTVKFEGGEWRTTAPAIARITERDRVEVCVEHFNFLRYTLKFDVAEQRSESYSYLTKLWSSILSPSLGAVLADAGPPQPTDLVGNLQVLYRLSRELDGQVAAATRPFVRTGLTASEAGQLATLRGDENTRPPTGVAGKLEITRNAFRALDNLILMDPAAFASVHGDRREMYRSVVDFYTAVDERAQIFLRLSAKTIGTEVKQVGKKNAGTRVTFALTAVDEASAGTPMDDVTYFVQSNMPLVAHGGISFAGLNDVSFEKVKRSATFGEEELFQQQGDAETSTGYTLFLGWQFYGSGDVATNARSSKVGAAFSIGTDVNRPGRRLFAGPSLMIFNRLVVSGGLVFGKEAEGQSVTLEPEVFRIVKERPKGTWFFSLSTRVY